ncbi:hypothetical protein B0H14DRAFT_3877598 [Mycena olivaceomarginata]|nr:hypothetical protein B0H14DRAFT_3877598 [Mycena olivaceomarginata]
MGQFILSGSVLNLFTAKCHTLCMHFAPPPHELVTRTPALDDAHQSVDTLGMLLRWGWFVLVGSVLSNLFAAQRHTLCMHFAPHPHELVTRTPALDDAHQSVDTLGKLLRWGRFVLAGSVLSSICSLQSVTHCACTLHPILMSLSPGPRLLMTHINPSTLLACFEVGTHPAEPQLANVWQLPFGFQLVPTGLTHLGHLPSRFLVAFFIFFSSNGHGPRKLTGV